MLGSFSAHKSIGIGEERRFCRSVRFRTDFPSELAGIIHPYEFQQSIKNINRARRPSFILRFASLIFIICMVIGFAVTIVGLALINNTDRTVWIVLTAIGIAVSVISIILSVCIAFNSYSSRTDQVIEAVNAESLKYITRRPIPLSWRLKVDTFLNRTYQYNHIIQGHETFYSLIIDIGKKIDGQNRNDDISNFIRNIQEPTSYIGQQQTHLANF
ncbi:hypothetical protein I4U23_020180 [Adineta vaga]|nr:hypothetical protein I4U23_020180 [Adineta vaga]